MGNVDDDEEYDRFVFHPGDLREITDPQVLASIYKKTGIYPLPEEKQSWVSEEAKKRYRMGLQVSTFELEDEYDRLKTLGQL